MYFLFKHNWQNKGLESTGVAILKPLENYMYIMQGCLETVPMVTLQLIVDGAKDWDCQPLMAGWYMPAQEYPPTQGSTSHFAGLTVALFKFSILKYLSMK